MREPSGDNLSDPHFAPAQHGHEPPPSVNGPGVPSEQRIASGQPSRSARTLEAPAATTKEKRPPEQKDAFREIVETVVFVVVLVLLLKAFMAEAFVIPTGSMATTLLGYHHDITCPECGFRFPLNLSKQLDEQEGANRENITGCTCPNCHLHIDASNSEEFRRQ